MSCRQGRQDNCKLSLRLIVDNKYGPYDNYMDHIFVLICLNILRLVLADASTFLV